MIASDLTGRLYNDLLDKNIEHLMNMGIDMRAYFNSNICFHKIDTHLYPVYHRNDQTYVLHSQLHDINEIYNNYDTVIEENIHKLSQSKLGKIFCRKKQRSLSYSSINHSSNGGSMRSFQSLSASMRNGGFSSLQEYQIEYFVVNLKYTLNHNKLFFMKAIQKAALKDIRLLEIPALQTIIKFKWRANAQDYYKLTCFLFLFVIGLFVLEINLGKVIFDEDLQFKIFVVCKVIQSILFGFLILIQIRLVITIGFKEYIKQPDRIIDRILAVIYIIYSAVSYST